MNSLFDCRAAFSETLVALAAQDPRIVVVANDSIGSSNLKEFRNRFPDRLINVGIAEQNMVGVSAGLAGAGKIPFTCAASCFLTGRALEQIKVDRRVRSTVDYLRKHRALFTFGENVGTDRFPVPLHKLKWLPTRQPVVTDLWKTNRAPAATAVFTSIANWSTSGQKDMEWRGEKYLWSKSREFLRFVAAPERSGEPFELATDINEEKTREKFVRSGWRFYRLHGWKWF